MTLREYLLHSELMPLIIAAAGFLIFIAVETIRAILRGNSTVQPTRKPRTPYRAHLLHDTSN